MHTAFFGDGEKTFALTPAWIRELERTTGHGIGTLFNRLMRQEYSFHDILETVRLAMIGGGTSPQDAANLIATYSVNRPISETLAIAVEVLSVVMFGHDEKPAQADEVPA